MELVTPNDQPKSKYSWDQNNIKPQNLTGGNIKELEQNMVQINDSSPNCINRDI